MLMNSKLDFLKKIAKNTQHGNDLYVNHCVSVANILKDFGCNQMLQDAGLFHSIYSTEDYVIDETPSRQEIQKIIGIDAEHLVFVYSNIRQRTQNILHNNFNFSYTLDKNLSFIEFANLSEQNHRRDDPELKRIVFEYNKKISAFNQEVKAYSINGKNIFVLDTLLDGNEIEHLHTFCKNSVYKPHHGSNSLNHYSDSRFVSLMSKSELELTGLIDKFHNIAEILDDNLYIGQQYINHYTLNTPTSRHCDSSDQGAYTILVFPNKYWEQEWGGEIGFYDDNDERNYFFNYKPGRIIVFDSRLSHNVFPISRHANADRYSIAIKSCVSYGVKDFEKIYNIHTQVEK